MSNRLDTDFIEHPFIWPRTIRNRLYQKTISDAASEKNTLVILPTALGKTVIAAITSGNILYNYRDAKILVLAPTRPLVIQHRNSFKKILKLRDKDILLLTGKIQPLYRTALWQGKFRIVFSTPQVVNNDLKEGRLRLENYGLLVFDECHRAVGKYAYTEIARFYATQAEYPLILAMTASPGSDIARITEVCRNLYIEHTEYRNEDDPDVKPYINPIEVVWKRVRLPDDYLILRSHIRRMLDMKLNWLRTNGIIRRNKEYVSRRDLIDAGDELRHILEESIEEERPRVLTAIVNQSLALTLYHMLVLLETQGMHTLRIFLTKVEREKKNKRTYAILVNNPDFKELKRLIDAKLAEHPKAELLKQIVESQVAKKASSRMLVFTQYRDTASHLVSILNKISGIRAEKFIGQGKTTFDKGLTQEEQSDRIRKLRDGELNLLVATSIAEEGLDIPAVDHVIFYEPIPSEIRYIQRRGRTGRKRAGKATILAAEETLDIIYLYVSTRRTEKMKRIASTLDSRLYTIERKKPKPEPKPVTPSDLKSIEEEATITRSLVEPKDEKLEREALNTIKRDVNRACRTIYMNLLKKGICGHDLSQIIDEMKIEGYSSATITSAIGKMIKEGQIVEREAKRYYVSSTLRSKDKETYDIKIEKIYSGMAIVRVNDRWRAMLSHEDYFGPRELIRKDSCFKAVASMHRFNGKLCIRITDVIQFFPKTYD